MTKRFLALCASLSLSIPATLAGETTLTSAQGLSVHGVQAGSTFAVTLRQGTQNAQSGVQVTIDERLKPYLDVTVSSGILTLGFRDLPRELQQPNKWSCPATAEVTLSRIDLLSASGMASIRSEGTFSGSAHSIQTSGMGTIGPITIAVTGSQPSDISLSGMSNASITLQGGQGASVKISGQSKLNLNCGAVPTLRIDVGGMSSASIQGGAPSLEVECSGQSTLSLDCGAIRSLTASTSGMSSMTIDGSADNVTSEASGSSHINLKEFKAKSVSAETSGMSGITVWPTESLDASSSGSSAIRYRSDGKLRLHASNFGSSSISSIH